MDRKQDLGPGARKIELERRLDRNTAVASGVARKAEPRRPSGRTRQERDVDEANDASFPASDPPGHSSPTTAGSPEPDPDPREDLDACIKACQACHRACLETAMGDCLQKGGKHVEPAHFSLMIACADLCQAAARLMMVRSEFHAELCQVCARVCAACAESCEDIGGMEDCVRACRECESSCNDMSR